MKKLIIPESKWGYTDAEWIIQTLEGMYKSNKKDGSKLTLYGAYKRIRQMELFAALGDWVVLSQCVKFLQSRKADPAEKEIYRCMLYFIPRVNWGERRRMAKLLISSPDRGFSKKLPPGKQKKARKVQTGISHHLTHTSNLIKEAGMIP
jgi:hypothetical protein